MNYQFYDILWTMAVADLKQLQFFNRKTVWPRNARLYHRKALTVYLRSVAPLTTKIMHHVNFTTVYMPQGHCRI